jgi:hypothetical protein
VSAGELNMAEKILKIQKVPENEVGRLMKEYAIDSPAKITKIANRDGTFDLEIVFSDTGEPIRK